MVAVPIPSIPAPTTRVVAPNGYATQAWRQYWTDLGAGGGASGATIYVNPGTGTNERLLNAALADYGNVNDYLSDGDANYDGAFARVLADKGKAYVPRNPWLGGSTYDLTVPIDLSTTQSIMGDGRGVTVIRQLTTNVPVIRLGNDIYDFTLRNFSHTHAGTPIACVGGTGSTHTSTLVDTLSVNPITAGWLVGSPIAGTGIPAGTVIAARTSTTLTLSAAATATAAGVALTVEGGGSGISQGQGKHSWVNNGLMFDLYGSNCWRAYDLGRAYYCSLQDCFASGAVDHGFCFKSNGLALVGVTPQPAPMQWYLDSCGSGINGGDGFHWESTATGAAFATSLSVGSMDNCSSYLNGGRGVAAIGNAAGPIYSMRIEGGLFGEDAGDCIYLDTWGNSHVIRPTLVELAGANGIHLTGNGTNIHAQNSRTEISVGHINGSQLDGVLTQGPRTKIVGGFFTNNGLAGTASRRNGINIFSSGVANSASATIIGIDAYDTGAAAQQYGVASNVDGIIISGSDLQGNLVSPIALPAIVNTIITGCLPASINVTTGGTATFTALTVTGVTQTQDLIVDRAIAHSTTLPGSPLAAHYYVPGGGMAFVGDVNIIGSLAASASIQATNNFVGTGATTISGVANITSSGVVQCQDLYATRSMHLAIVPAVPLSAHFYGPLGGIAFVGDVNMINSLAVTQSIQAGNNFVGTGATTMTLVDSIALTGATGGLIAGSLNANTNVYVDGVAIGFVGGVYTGNLEVTGQLKMQDAWITRSMGLTSAPDTVAGHFSGSPIAFQGASINMIGSLAVTQSVQAGVNFVGTGSTYITGVQDATFTGQVKTQDLWVTRSMGLGAAPDGVTAHFAGPGGGIAFSGGLDVNVTGALAVTGNVQAQSLYATVSGGIGTAPSGVAGQLDVSAIIATGQVKMQDVWVTRSMGLTTSPDGTAGHIAGTPIAFTGASINMTGALAVTGNVQAQSLYATASLGVGTAPSGTTGRIDMTGALTGGTTGLFSGQVQMQDAYITRSMGLAASPDGTSAHITGPGGGIAFSGSVGVNFTGNAAFAGGITMNSTLSVNSNNVTGVATLTATTGNITTVNATTVAGGTVSASTDLKTIGGGTAHFTGGGAIAMSGGITVSSGGIAVTGGVTADNASVTGGIAVGGPTGGVLGAGTVNVATSVNLNSTPYTNP